MSWFRVDDKAAFHKKVLKVGNAGFGALVRMGCWSSDHLTDGRIPIETALLITTDHELQKLCFVGFLEPDGDDFIIHDFLDYNPTAAEVIAERERISEAKSKAGKAGGIASGVTRRNIQAAKQAASSCFESASVLLEANAKQNEAPSHPVPSHLEDQKKPSPASPVESFDFESVYALYPRKEGRKKGLARCRSSVKTRSKYDALLLAVKNYAATVTDVAYAKHFDTFMNCWEDYVDAGLLTPRQSTARANGPLPPREAVTEDSTSTL